MTIIFGIVEFSASFVELYILYLIFVNIFKDQRKYGSVYIDIGLSIIGTIIVLFCNQLVLFSYLTIVIVGVYLSISTWILYDVNYITAFSIVSFYLLFMNSFDFFILTLISNFCHGSETVIQIISAMSWFRVIVISVIKILWLLLYIFVRKYMEKLSLSIKGTYFILLTSICGFMGFIYLADRVVKVFDSTIPLVWFMIICVLAMIIFIIYYTVMRKEEKIENSILEMRNSMLSEKYNSLNEIYMSNSKLFHDLNNHLNVLYQLLEEENVLGAKEYIQQIGEPILKLSKVAWTGVSVVDVVLNSKIQKMKELGIDANVNVEIPQNANIYANDLCTVLSNLLDNAIEAVEKLENNKKITIIIRRINFFLFIRVVNPCIDLKKFKTFPTTKKENNVMHGWGLQSVNDVVSKYDGTIECINDNGEFMVDVMLMFDEKRI